MRQVACSFVAARSRRRRPASLRATWPRQEDCKNGKVRGNEGVGSQRPRKRSVEAVPVQKLCRCSDCGSALSCCTKQHDKPRFTQCNSANAQCQRSLPGWPRLRRAHGAAVDAPPCRARRLGSWLLTLPGVGRGRPGGGRRAGRGAALLNLQSRQVGWECWGQQAAL